MKESSTETKAAASHTPGPWSWQEERSVSLLNGNSAVAYEVYKAKGEFAHIGTFSRESDAILGSSAPDLVKACERAISALYNVPEVGRKYDRQHSDTHMRAVLDLQAAIAKARGQ